MSEYDSTFVFMPFAEAQAYFNLEDEASAIEIYLDDPDRSTRSGRRSRQAAERQILLTDWQQRNITFFSALEVERNVMFLILTLIVLVAALNIISGLTMLVKDKGHDIAILRTMGATRGAIMRVFFITGASIGTVGTLAGFLLGVVICLNIEIDPQLISRLTSTEVFSPELYFLSQLPADMDPRETDHGDRHGAGAVVPGDALSRPGARRASIRSRRCATNERATASRDALAARTAGPAADRGRAPLQRRRRPADRPRRRRPRGLSRRDGGAGRAVRAPASRRSSTSPGCSSGPTPATSSLPAGRPAVCPIASGPRSAASRSASSISSITCCRSSPRSRTS